MCNCDAYKFIIVDIDGRFCSGLDHGMSCIVCSHFAATWCSHDLHMFVHGCTIDAFLVVILVWPNFCYNAVEPTLNSRNKLVARQQLHAQDAARDHLPLVLPIVTIRQPFFYTLVQRTVYLPSSTLHGLATSTASYVRKDGDTLHPELTWFMHRIASRRVQK